MNEFYSLACRQTDKWNLVSQCLVSEEVDSIVHYILLLTNRHTGVVVYGREYFYGGMGIEYCPPVSDTRTHAHFTH